MKEEYEITIGKKNDFEKIGGNNKITGQKQGEECEYKNLQHK